MDTLLLNKLRKPKLISGGVVRPSQIRTGIIQLETVGSGGKEPVVTGGGVISDDTPVTPTVRYTLTINALPSDAVVKINGVKRNTASIVENMTARYTVSADGYVSQSGEVVMTQDKTINVELVAIPKYTFTINALPSNAVVMINGEQTNSITVYENTEISWSVEAENYITQSGNLVLTKDTTLDISLDVPKYTFAINATPSNAVIVINGVQQSSISAVNGTEISYEVSAEGYVSESGTLILTEDQTINVALVEIPKYTFTIVPTPNNAVVTINGDTIKSITAVAGTEINYEVSADGYVSENGTLTLTENKTINVTLSAIPKYTFTINATPSDAIVLINGVQQSSITAYENTNIEWSVVAEGYSPQSGKLVLVENTTLDVVLEVEVEVDGARLFTSGSTTWYLTENGELYGCGSNNYGHQGNGTTNTVYPFTKRAENVKDVACSGHTTWYITKDGDLYGCGNNNYGQQGDGTTTNVTTFTKRASNVKSVSVVNGATWYITKDGGLYGCGLNDNYQQGDNSTTNVTTFTKRADNVKDVKSASESTLYLTKDGDLYSCGKTGSGISSSSTKTFTKVASNVKGLYCDTNTSWYLDANNDLYGAGDSKYYQQGNDSTSAVYSFTKRASNVKDVSCSQYTTWYITNDNELYGCGWGTFSQQGSNSTSNVKTFTKRADNVKSVSCSIYTTWYLTNDNELYGCGYNSFGQQGSNSTSDVRTFTKRASNVKDFDCSDNTTWYVDNNDNLYGCGHHLGSTSDPKTFIKITVGG